MDYDPIRKGQGFIHSIHNDIMKDLNRGLNSSLKRGPVLAGFLLFQLFIGVVSGIGSGLTGGMISTASAAPVPFTILHTNDLHSHFREEKTTLG